MKTSRTKTTSTPIHQKRDVFIRSPLLLPTTASRRSFTRRASEFQHTFTADCRAYEGKQRPNASSRRGGPRIRMTYGKLSSPTLIPPCRLQTQVHVAEHIPT